MSPDSVNPSQPADQVILKVDGMTCASCAQSIQRTLEGQEGVETAVVSLPLNRATISGRDVDAAVMAKVIKKSGFDAEPFSEAQTIGELLTDIEQQQLRNTSRWGWRAVLGLSIFIPLEILHWTFRGCSLSPRIHPATDKKHSLRHRTP